MLSDDELAHEELRRNVGYIIKCAAFQQPLMGVDWGRPENARWLDTADRIIALVEAPRRRTIDGLRAENEQLRWWQSKAILSDDEGRA